MSVRREPGGTRYDGTARPDRIVVPLGGVETALTETQATRLRDELTAALGGGSEPAAPAVRDDDSAAGANRVSDADLERAIGWFRGDHPVNAITRAALVELRDRRAAAAGCPVAGSGVAQERAEGPGRPEAGGRPDEQASVGSRRLRVWTLDELRELCNAAEEARAIAVAENRLTVRSVRLDLAIGGDAAEDGASRP